MSIRYRAEFIVNAHQYEHVAVWIEGDTLEEFARARDELTDEVTQSLAITHTAIKSQLEKAWEAGHSAGVAMMERELGATVESESEVPPKPSWSTPMDPSPKPWAETRKKTASPPTDW